MFEHDFKKGTVPVQFLKAVWRLQFCLLFLGLAKIKNSSCVFTLVLLILDSSKTLLPFPAVSCSPPVESCFFCRWVRVSAISEGRCNDL